jgi:AAA ATPase domain
MKLTAFRIENYRCIQDSGWVEVDDIAVIVGKNESGKTSLLKALWKFKPFHDAKYDLDREWPRGRRKEKFPDKVVATVRFEFTTDEVTLIASLHESAKGISDVEIKRSYDGHYRYNFLPNSSSGADLKHLAHRAPMENIRFSARVGRKLGRGFIPEPRSVKGVNLYQSCDMNRCILREHDETPEDRQRRRGHRSRPRAAQETWANRSRRLQAILADVRRHFHHQSIERKTGAPAGPAQDGPHGGVAVFVLPRRGPGDGG